MKQRKGLWVVAVAIVLLVAAYFATQNRERAHSGDDGAIKVATILSLTGPAARFDAVKQNTMNVALARLKTIFPEVEVSVEFFDSGSGPETTIAATQRAAGWGAEYYLTGTSPSALAVASQVRSKTRPVAQLANAANPDFGPPRNGEYRFWPDWKQEAQIVVDLLRKNDISKVLLVHSADPYSEALQEEFRSFAGGNEAMEISSIRYDPAATFDFRPAVRRAQVSSIDAVVVFGLPPGIRSLIGQLAEVGWGGTLVGGVNINLAVADFDEAGLSGPLWLIRTSAMQDTLPPNSEAAAFRELYENEYGERPPFHALYLADALFFIANAAINEPGLARADPPAALARVESFDGPSGKINVNADMTLEFEMHAERVR